MRSTRRLARPPPGGATAGGDFGGGDARNATQRSVRRPTTAANCPQVDEATLAAAAAAAAAEVNYALANASESENKVMEMKFAVSRLAARGQVS